MRMHTFRLSLLAALFCVLIWIPAFVRSEGAITSSAEAAGGANEETNEKKQDEIEEEEGSDEGSGSESEDEPETDEALYFYLSDKDSVVTEYKAPEGDGVEDKPDFLYNPDPGRIRIVEFYAHWCPHCQHFRTQFNEFAKQIKGIAKTNNLEIDIYAVSCVPHRPICREKGIEGYPKIMVFADENVKEDEGELISYGLIHPFKILQLIFEKRGGDTSSILSMMEGQEESTTSNAIALSSGSVDADTFWIHKTKYDVYCDIYLSFHFAMQHSVFVGKDPPDKKTKDAFGKWIELLSNVLPPSWPLSVMISEIWKNIETVLDSEDNLLGIVDKYPPPKKTWSPSCTRGDPTMGYTCGLWQLFHAVSVGVVEWNENNLVGDKHLYYRPRNVGKTFRDYIDHFFGCEVCRENFLLEYDNCGHFRCERLIPATGKLGDWKEVPFWLYEVHNGVNERLLEERLEKEGRKPTPEEKIAVQWPSRKDCPLCWRADGTFNYDGVHAFLKMTYWPNELFSSETREELMTLTGLNTYSDQNGGYESW
eukprot:CAMPEP_0116124578 /NCGR_PEP_ID=MMETSP0329-20121206/5352_1 /TAXON_ID=697910 /ORGANISM="Pseudo-nitzschia arenysensis, Strain B593" /LENGTH=535 /DNA_ID=CAMNT_0003618561 /DNA_START=57 /DNA_END=1661 /DNA_ORIENTATION=+